MSIAIMAWVGDYILVKQWDVITNLSLIFNGGLVNSMVAGRCEWNFRHVIFKLILVTDGWGIS